MIGTTSPLASHADETICTMKFADRAMKVHVKATANEINSKDDKLVQKLKREVSHLKQILQMKGKNESNDKILSALSELNNNTEEVERLKQENKKLRLILQQNQNEPMTKQTDEQMIKWIEYKPDEEYKETNSKFEHTPYVDRKEYDMNILNKENTQNNNYQKESSFFITETNDPKTESKSKPIKPQLPSIMDVLSDSKARKTVLSMINKTDNTSKSNFHTSKSILAAPQFALPQSETLLSNFNRASSKKLVGTRVVNNVITEEESSHQDSIKTTNPKYCFPATMLSEYSMPPLPRTNSNLIFPSLTNMKHTANTEDNDLVRHSKISGSDVSKLSHTNLRQNQSNFMLISTSNSLTFRPLAW